MMQKKTYNGVIDCWKILFCIIIVIFHIGEAFGEGRFPFYQGRFGVEFFFIVSGYFMCSHVMRQPCADSKNIGSENVKFIFGKVKKIFPAYIFAWVIAFGEYIYFVALNVLRNDGVRKFILNLVYAIPNLLLLDMSGIASTEVLGISWYVSAMLLVMFITYPLLRKLGRNYCLIIAPAIAIFLTGFYCAAIGGYHGKEYWTGIMFHGLLRGFVSINIGCIAYMMGDYLKRAFEGLTSFKRVSLRIAEPIAYLSAVALMYYGDANSVHMINILILVAVSVTMSGYSMFMGICNNGFCRQLGKISLWMYFCQSPAKKIVIELLPNISYRQAFVYIWILTIAYTALGMGITALISKLTKKSKVIKASA